MLYHTHCTRYTAYKYAIFMTKCSNIRFNDNVIFDYDWLNIAVEHSRLLGDKVIFYEILQCL
jgi:hypothetical protein